MKDVLVLGAGGQIARWVVERLGDHNEVELTLFLRTTRKLSRNVPANAEVVQGDVLRREQLIAQWLAMRLSTLT